MTISFHQKLILSAVTIAALSGPLMATCGAAACPVHIEPRLPAGQWELRTNYIYIDQSTLMEGSSAKDPGSSTAHHTETETYTRMLNAELAYQIDRQWGASITVPWAWRKHAHVHHHHGEALHDEWEMGGLGDIWIDTSYGFETTFLGRNEVVIEAGIKLPTGITRFKNGDGDEAEPSVQIGSGSTDYRLGASYQIPIWTYRNWDGQYVEMPLQFYGQYTINGSGTDGWENGDLIVGGFRTHWSMNNMIQVSGGLSGQYQYTASAGTTGEDIETTGGKSIRLNLGVSAQVASNIQLGISGWLPLHQSVNGEQLGLDSIVQTQLTVKL